MALSQEEIAKRDRFSQAYAMSQNPTNLSVERLVCGCNYGAYSLTTRDEARQMAELLGLQRGIRLLDVGAGAGWPGLYMAKETGCDAILVDLPLSGLQVANERAAKDRIIDRCWTAVADGSQMPFRDNSFDAVSHSDILCCLKDKFGVLQSCRQVIRDGGRMVFTVISITHGLSRNNYKRALQGAPEFAELETDYSTMLGETGWTITGCTNVTEGYASTIRRQIHADSEFRNELELLLGAAEFADRQVGWQSEIGAIEAGLIRRDLFVVIPTT